MQQSKSTHKQKQGFSLIELLVVMAIIAILMGLVIGVSGAVTRKAAEARARAEISDLMQEIEIYKSDKGSYPAGSDLSAFMQWYTNEKYVGTLYTLTELDGSKLPIDPWGNKYLYGYNPSNPFVYLIGSYGPDGKKGGNGSSTFGENDDITNRNGAL